MAGDGNTVDGVWRELTERAKRITARLIELSRDAFERLQGAWRERAKRSVADAEARASASRSEPRSTARSRPVEAGAPVLVESDDDVATVLGRIDAAERADVVLVVPRRSRAMRHASAWAHVAAHARQRGVNVSVLAARGDVRAYAAGSGLRSARTARGLRTRPQPAVELGGVRVPIPELGIGQALRVGFLVALVTAAFVVGCYVVPSAEVVLVPVTSEVVERQTVRVNPLVLEPDADLGVVPGATLRETVTTIVSTATTGTASVGDAFATVELRFENEGETPIEVTAGTIVRDDAGLEFALDEAVEVPPAGVATVGATALDAGENGNVAARTLFVLTGLADTLSVSNPAAATGGTDIEVPAVAQEDVDRVGSIATQVLERLGLRQLEEQAQGGQVFPQTVDVSIFSQTPLQTVGEPADAFLVEYTAIVTVLAVTDRSARAYGEALISARLDEAHALLPGAVSVEVEGPGTLQGGQLTAELVATGQVADRVDASTWGEQLKGASPDTARARLEEGLALQEEPRINLEPGWLPWMWLPRRADRISIRLDTPTLDAPSDATPAEDGGEDATETPTPAASRVGGGR
ncbi:MAG: baseplate J/gp47 family protein [Dehalococcoidia bacterium]